MLKWFGWTLFLLLSLDGFAQRERVHLDLDKYSCKAGDTIYIKGVVFKGTRPSRSSNLYICLYREGGIPLQRYTFPLQHGEAIGQVILPDSLPTDNYYILALTKQQLNYDTSDFFSVPVLVYNRDKPAIRNHKRPILNPASTTSGTIKGITWITSLYEGQLSSLLTVDSGSDSRHLQVIHPLTKDSILGATVVLDNSSRQKYCLFPVNSSRYDEVLLLFEDSLLIGRQVIHLKDYPRLIQLTTDTLDTEPFGYNAWKLDIPGPGVWNTSIEVTDADRSLPSSAPITRLNDSYTDNFTIPDSLVDTAYISYSGKATRDSGKKIKDAFSQQIVIAGVRDSNYIFMKTVDIDPAGNFRLDSLSFSGVIDLQFQINKDQDGSNNDIQLSLARFTPPVVDAAALERNWEDDKELIGKKDTAFTRSELQQYELSKFKTLKAAVVRGWKNPRNELDEKYANGPFSEPAMEFYDLRSDSSEYNRDIFWYLNVQGGRLSYDPQARCMVDYAGHHPIHYFVDEVEYHSADDIRMFEFDRLAYVKILESDFLSTERPSFELNPVVKSGPFAIPEQKTAINVCIYTRKGTDFRTMRGGMNKATIMGYSKILPFTSDKVTLFWHPQESGRSFNIHFNNAETTKKFRVKVEAINQTGEIIHYETVVSR